MSNDLAIKVENLSKYYRLGVINNGTLFRDIQTWWARVRGKEDPHAKIGSKYDPTAEGFWALKDLNFEIKKGDRVGIIGHNGAGKSTLLKLLSQITAPTEGSIKINGKIASLLEVGTGFHPEMTGRENIYMNGAILGMKHDEIDKKVNDIIEFSEIGEHIDTPVKRYSSGMYVRLAFAVAAHLDSDILIADEVLAVGDAAFQKKALGKMNELSSGQGRTVLFVSHNMSQIKNLCNKGIVLEKGKIVRQDNDINKSIEFYLSANNTIILDDGAIELTSSHGIETKEIAFSSIRLLNEKKESSFEFLTNSKMILEINIEKLKNYRDVAYCIAILDSFGRWVTSYATWMKNLEINENSKRIIVTIPKLNFGAGQYHIYLSCTLYTAGVYLDKIESAASFKILPDDTFGTGRCFTIDDGVILPNGKMEII